ncbi:MAG: 2-oxo-4-hydroxy-4-carboxy-5-ureidoimidazoline decarboxylase [Mycobacterium sp.]
MHQGVGLETFNTTSEKRAVHALFECCNSVGLARSLAHGRPYADHDALFRRADAMLFSLPDAAIDEILEAYPQIGARPGSVKSAAEQCSVWNDDTSVMAELDAGALRYRDRFGFMFVMYVGGASCAEVAAALSDRMHNDSETELKVVRNELAKINRTRLERMLGPEGGYQNW